MSKLLVIAHPEVAIKPAQPVPDWGLNAMGHGRALPLGIDPLLGENDRSATGYLPHEEFEAAANAFFEQPDASFCGWETAVEA